MKSVLLSLTLLMMIGCEEFNANNIVCNEDNKCPDLHYCESDHCIKSECLNETKDKNGDDCINPQKCNIFTGNCEEIIVCDINGIIDQQDCGYNNKGKQSVVCKDGRWEDIGSCVETDECQNDEIVLSEELCGINKSGKKNKLCENGVLVDTELCKESDINCIDGCIDDDVCINTTQRDDILPCGINSAGLQKEICSDGQWIADLTCEIEEENCINGCIDDDVCINDEIILSEEICGFNNNGKQNVKCIDGKYESTTECLPNDTDCINGCVNNDVCEYDDIQTSTTCGFGNETNTTEICYQGAEWMCNTFIKQIGSNVYEKGLSIAVDGFGNVFITGETKGNLDGVINNGAEDIFLTKYDKYGNKLWTKLYGTTSVDGADGIAIDSDNNIYLTGKSNGIFGGPVRSECDAFIIKLTNDGDIIWTRYLTSNSYDYGISIAVTDTDVYVAGFTRGDLDGNQNKNESTTCNSINGSDDCLDIFVTKYNKDGEKQWVKQLGTPFDDRAVSIKISNSGNIYIAGSTKGNISGANAGVFDVFVIKLNNEGNILQTTQFGTAEEDKGLSIAVDENENVFLTGFTDGAFNNYTDLNGTEIFLAKYDNQNNQQYIKQLGTEGKNEEGYAITVTNNNIYITGYTYSHLESQLNKGFSDIFLSKFDFDGTVISTKLFGSDKDEHGKSIVVKNNKIYITGYTNGSLYDNVNAGDFDSFFMQLEE